MAVKLTFDNIIPSTVPAGGWTIRYRVKDSGGAYTTVTGISAQPIEITTTDVEGTLYEGFISRDCDNGAPISDEFPWISSCECDTDYNVAASGLICESIDIIPATVTSSGYCLTFSVNVVYSEFETRIYKPSFLAADATTKEAAIGLPSGSSGGLIETSLVASPQWSNPSGSLEEGPLNREGVWIDSDCDGFRDPLSLGTEVTIAYIYNNVEGPRQVYVGIASDNQFKLVVNGTIIVETPTLAATGAPFKIWHVIPVNIVAGTNYFNAVGTGDGLSDDSIGMVIYDNTLGELVAASSDADLNVLFHSGSLRLSSYDVATCPVDYSLDTSGGVGNYTCIKISNKVCNDV